jgi:hypothetical protein
MYPRTLGRLALLVSTVAAGLEAQSPTYPPFRDYSMPRDAELQLVRTAAPANIVDRASLKVLTQTGYQVTREGDNGFTCLVMRGWSAPTYTPKQFLGFTYEAAIRAPICFDPIASRTVVPYYELRSKLGMEGKTPNQIADAVASAYATGALPKREGVSFAYMWSAEQHLGQGIGHWRPHVMVFAPYYTNEMVGGTNEMVGGNAFGSPFPQLSDDAGTPFAVVVIPVDQSLAFKAKGGRP